MTAWHGIISRLMAVQITLQDIINQTNDLVANYTTSTIDLGNTTRAVNRAIEYVQRRLGLPSDRKISSFNYYDDTRFYALPVGYGEDIELYYNTSNANVDADHNVSENRWDRTEDTAILRSTGQYRLQNRYAFTTMNGSNQLILDGSNLRGRSMINPLESLTGLTFSSSISGAAVDGNIFKQGSGSVSFNVSTGESTSTITMTGFTYDIRAYLNGNAAYRLYVYFPTGVTTSVLTNIGLNLISSTGNSYNITTTTDYLSAAWASNGWSLLSFPLANATQTGSPVASNITSISITLPHAGSFVPFTTMRIDDFYVVVPDYLDLAYYSTYKGTNSTGSTLKVLLDTASDIASFGSFAPDLIWPISIKAAEILMPQLRADLNFRQLLSGDFEKSMLLYGKQYPRKRNTNAGPTSLRRG